MKKLLLTAILILSLAIPASAFENLNNYGEVDPNSRLTVDSNSKVSHAGLTRQDPETFIYKDLGEGAIVEATSMSYIAQSIDPVGNSSYIVNFFWNNTIGGYLTRRVAGDKVTAQYTTRSGTDVQRFIFSYFDGSVNHFDLGNDTTYTERLLAVSRSGQTYTCIIYSGTTIGSGVFDTLLVAAGEVPPDFQINHVSGSFSDSANANTHQGFVRNMEFTGLITGNPQTHLGYRFMEFF